MENLHSYLSKNLIFFILLITVSCGKEKDSPVPVSMDDPLYSFQWHLKNNGQLGGTDGEDINVTNVWSDGNKGEGVLVSVIDDGLEISHNDLKENVKDGMSYNYTNGSTNPGGSNAVHGTCVAGVIAARDMNGAGVKGVASRASLMGLNLIADGNATDINIQDALVRNIHSVYVSNNSWGYVDGTGHFFPAQATWRTAIETGLSMGRGGKGTVYIWAGGNGGNSGPDLSNYDGLTNFYGMMGVCAIGDDGKKASYSEKGANLWICAPSMGRSGKGVATTDLAGGTYGSNKSSSSSDFEDKDYTKRFNGTSAAAPVVSGVVALMLKVNPDLTWRDVKLILAKTARKNHSSDSGWSTNGAGISIHDSYGFGVVDADNAVNTSRTWTNVESMVTRTMASSGTIGTLTDGGSLTSTLSVTGSGISRIEFIEITVNFTHSDWGELDIQLKRSGGGYSSISQLSLHHDCLNPSTLALEDCKVQGTPDDVWVFGSAKHLDEPADGPWQLVVSEKTGGTAGGTWNSWSLKFFGR